MSNNKRVQSNVFEIKRSIEEVDSGFRKLDKTFVESAEVMKAYAVKTNAGLFNDIAAIVEGHGETVKAIIKLNDQTLEASIAAHKQMQNVTDSLDI